MAKAKKTPQTLVRKSGITQKTHTGKKQAPKSLLSAAPTGNSRSHTTQVRARWEKPLFGAGVASPEERLANRVNKSVTATSPTKVTSQKTRPSNHRSAPAPKPQPAKSYTGRDDFAAIERLRIWLSHHDELMSLALTSGNITSLDQATSDDAKWIVENSMLLPLVQFKGKKGAEWQSAATNLFVENHPDRKSCVRAVEAAMFSLNKALSDLVAQGDRLNFSALSVAH